MHARKAVFFGHWASIELRCNCFPSSLNYRRAKNFKLVNECLCGFIGCGHSLVWIRTSACHADDPGSNPGGRTKINLFIRRFRPYAPLLPLLSVHIPKAFCLHLVFPSNPKQQSQPSQGSAQCTFEQSLR